MDLVRQINKDLISIMFIQIHIHVTEIHSAMAGIDQGQTSLEKTYENI